MQKEELTIKKVNDRKENDWEKRCYMKLDELNRKRDNKKAADLKHKWE